MRIKHCVRTSFISVRTYGKANRKPYYSNFRNKVLSHKGAHAGREKIKLQQLVGIRSTVTHCARLRSVPTSISIEDGGEGNAVWWRMYDRGNAGGADERRPFLSLWL